jgi:5-methylcytosine-specific restriction protein A
VSGWVGSTRRSTLPAGWARIRVQVLARDHHRCVWCGAPATDVDHIGDPAVHDLGNLRALCRACHQWRSARQGSAAAAAARARKPRHQRLADAQRKPRQARPPEPHPGLTTHAGTAGRTQGACP